MLRLQSEAPNIHLERARDRVGGSRTALCADYWRGECPVRGWWQRGSQKQNKPSKPPEIHDNGKKTGGFASVLAYKSTKTLFFRPKVLNKIYSRDVFQKYVNFQNHYLSHCGVIPVGSHIGTPPAARIRVRTATLRSELTDFVLCCTPVFTDEEF